VIREDHLIPVGRVFDDEPEAVFAVTVTAPEAARLVDPPPVYFCVPGGGLDRGYYDLRAGASMRFSFAAQMAERGGITVAIDPLGIGGSTRPRRGFELTAEVHARALARLHDAVSERLRAGSLLATLPPLPGLLSIGVGHSVGALLILFQQVAERDYDALALLGFGTQGLPSALDDELRKYAGDAAGARANATRLAQRWYDDPYPVLEVAGRGREIYGGRPDPQAMQAMRGCRAPLLATVAVFVIIPGSSAPEGARVDVPLLLAAGDSDLCGPARELAADFPRSPAVSVLELADTGHSHFAFPSVDELFPRLAAWAGSLGTARAPRQAHA
jgi:alpha-beta hydrolase superfamily lysophospholipase